MAKPHYYIYGLLGSLVLVACDESAPVAGANQIKLVCSPAEGTVSGILDVQVVSQTGVQGRVVELWLDDESYHETDLTPPFTFQLDTRKLKDGPHSLMALMSWQSGEGASSRLPITIDNTSPTLTFLSPGPQAKVLPPGELSVQLSASDASPLASAGLQVDGGAPQVLPLPSLQAQVILPESLEYPQAHSLSAWVSDGLGQRSVVGQRVEVTRERYQLDEVLTGNFPSVVGLSSGQLLRSWYTRAEATDPDGQSAWELEMPVGRETAAGMAGSRGEVILPTYHPVDGPIFQLWRVDSTGEVLWKYPEDEDRAVIEIAWSGRLADTLTLSTVSLPWGGSQTGRLEVVDEGGQAISSLLLEEGYVGAEVKRTGEAVEPGATAVLEADALGVGAPRLAVFADGESVPWAVNLPVDKPPARIYALNGGVAVAVLPGYQWDVYELHAYDSEGEIWSYSGEGNEKLTHGVVLPNGDLLARGEVDGYKGRLTRLGPDGSRVYQVSFDSSIQAWAATGDEVVVSLGDRVLRLNGMGEEAWRWAVPQGADLTEHLVVNLLISQEDGGVVAAASSTQACRIWQLDEGGELVWTQKVAGGYLTGLQAFPEQEAAWVWRNGGMNDQGQSLLSYHRLEL